MFSLENKTPLLADSELCRSEVVRAKEVMKPTTLKETSTPAVNMLNVQGSASLNPTTVLFETRKEPMTFLYYVLSLFLVVALLAIFLMYMMIFESKTIAWFCGGLVLLETFLVFREFMTTVKLHSDYLELSCMTRTRTLRIPLETIRVRDPETLPFVAIVNTLPTASCGNVFLECKHDGLVEINLTQPEDFVKALQKRGIEVDDGLVEYEYIV